MVNIEIFPLFLALFEGLGFFFLLADFVFHIIFFDFLLNLEDSREGKQMKNVAISICCP